MLHPFETTCTRHSPIVGSHLLSIGTGGPTGGKGPGHPRLFTGPFKTVTVTTVKDGRAPLQKTVGDGHLAVMGDGTQDGGTQAFGWQYVGDRRMVVSSGQEV